MKKLITIIGITVASILLLTSCFPAAKTIVSYIDYSKYYEEGLMITPNPYYGEFTPCGEISITITPAYPDNTIEHWVSEGSVKYQDPNSGSWQTKKVKEDSKLDEILEIAVNEAKERGADAITNFKVEVKFYQNSNNIESVSLYGFCIKRNDK